MKVIKTIKIEKSNIDELSKLDCVDSIDCKSDGTISVRIGDKYTKGNQVLFKGDYLCQFESGLWQRFGSEALNRIFKNPAKEAGKQW